MKYPGYFLLELLLSTAISTILLSALFVTLYQMNRSKKNIDIVISRSIRASLIQQQLQRDIMGVFVPVTTSSVQKEEKEEAETPAKPGEQKNAPTAQAEQTNPKASSEKTSIEKIFFSKNKGANLETLTFITNNPMPVYWNDKAGKAQPKIVRVVYRLQPDPVRRGSFILLRQEGDDLQYASYDPGLPTEKQKFRLYEVVDGVKNFSAVYYYVPLEKKEPTNPGQKPSEQKKPVKKELKTVKEWLQQKEDIGQQAGRPEIPRYVEIKVVLWDTTYQRDSEWKFTIPIVEPVPLSNQNKPAPEAPAAKKEPTKPQSAVSVTALNPIVVSAQVDIEKGIDIKKVSVLGFAQ
jgi:type II secretory pathway component PulJ